MSTNLKFRGSTLKVIADDEKKAKEYLQKFEKRAEKFAAGHNNVTDLKLALISAIVLEEEFESVTNEVEELRRQSVNENKQNDVHLIETLNYVSSCLENIANKFQKV